MSILTADITLTDADFQRISDFVYRHCGINLHEGKRQLVQARLSKRLREGNYASAAEYIDHVLSDESGDEITAMIDVLSTNLTSFFREPRHFDYLKTVTFPRLMKTKEHSRRIRAWSAGCSTGEEPYTLGITLLEAFGDWDIKILATDISTRVLRKAKEGVYPQERVNTVDPALRNKYFVRSGLRGSGSYQLAPAVSQTIRFRHLNLMEPWPFSGPFDFIFCRNVMIYFDKPTQEKLVRRYYDCLESGGLLFTGHSESLTGIAHPFRYVEPSIYQKP